MQEILRGSSLIARIMRETEYIDVLAVADPSKVDESLRPLAGAGRCGPCRQVEPESMAAPGGGDLHRFFTPLRVLYTDRDSLY